MHRNKLKKKKKAQQIRSFKLKIKMIEFFVGTASNYQNGLSSMHAR